MPKSQMEIPGTERTSIPEIDDAANAYVSVRDKRMALTEKEVAAKVNLLQVVQANAAKLVPDGDGNKTYAFDDFIVVLKPGKPNIKVKTATADDDGDGDDD